MQSGVDGSSVAATQVSECYICMMDCDPGRAGAVVALVIFRGFNRNTVTTRENGNAVSPAGAMQGHFPRLVSQILKVNFPNKSELYFRASPPLVSLELSSWSIVCVSCFVGVHACTFFDSELMGVKWCE